MSYFVYFYGVHATFRSQRGDIHRGFDVDRTSLGSICRRTLSAAFRAARYLSDRYGVDMAVDQCVSESRRGFRQRWFSKSWAIWPSNCAGPGQAPKVTVDREATSAPPTAPAADPSS